MKRIVIKVVTQNYRRTYNERTMINKLAAKPKTQFGIK